MRWLLALLLVPTAMACTSDEPCLLRVHTDDEGLYFASPDRTEVALDQGDWYILDVWNGHRETHRLFLEHYGVKIDATPFGPPADPTTRSDPVQFTDDGAFLLQDETSGDEATIVVRATEGFTHNVSTPAPQPTTTSPAPATSQEKDRVRSVPLPLASVFGGLWVASWLRR